VKCQVYATEMQGRCFRVCLLPHHGWLVVCSSDKPGFLDLYGKLQVPRLQKLPFPHHVLPKLEGQQLPLLCNPACAEKPNPLDSPFLLPRQAEGNAVNKWKGSVLPLFPDSPHQMRAQESVIKENIPQEKLS